ncbi:MAG: helix-turn-helix domain-containing protein [Planctomycetia bacterium]|nr:helix-turn-helix domain-containing protein [Planctomycetia bacterium]
MSGDLPSDGDDGEPRGSGFGKYEPMEPLLLTAEVAADLLCISESTLWWLVKRDRIRCVEIIARGFRRPIRRFRLSDLQAFVDGSLR